MNILIETVDHAKQRYDTVGDWQVDASKDTLYIRVSKMGNHKFEMLVALHELVEALLCLDRHISQEVIDQFDIAYEKKRKPGDMSEPGNDRGAPYRKEHFFATLIEQLMAMEYNIYWEDYNNTVERL